MDEEIIKINFKSLISFFKKAGFDRVHHESTNIFEVQEFNLTPIKLDVHFITPFFFPKSNLSKHKFISNEILLDLLTDAQEYVRKLNRKFGVMVVNSKVEDRDETINDFSDAKIALLTKTDLEELFKEKQAESIHNKLGLLLTKYLGLDFLSPYIPGRPARGGRFFGRSQLVHQMVGRKNHYIIIGNRRIGKTSLLGQVATQLEKKWDTQIIELYGGKWMSAEDVIFEFYIKLGMDKQANDSLEMNRSRMINDFPRQVNLFIKEYNRPLAIFIDEFDQFIHIDEKMNSQLISTFREIAGNENCRLFFAGFRKTREAIESLNHPLHNFAIFLNLKPFNRNETYQMVETPLTRLGIKINDDIAETIYQQTGGLPELIQIYCAEIVSFYSENGIAPKSQELLQAVVNSDEFKNKIYIPFLANTLPAEQLICFLILQNVSEDERTDQIEFTLDDVNRLLEMKNVYFNLHQLESIIINLRASAVIEEVTGTKKYKFTVPQLINYIKDLNLEFRIIEILSRTDNELFSVKPSSPVINVITINENQNTLYWTGEKEKIFLKHLTSPTIFRGSFSKSIAQKFNSEFQEIFVNNVSVKDFKKNLFEKARHFYLELKDGIGDIKELSELEENAALCIESYPEGLSVPFELIPFSEKHYLATRIAVSRRLRFNKEHLDFHKPFHLQFAELRKRGEPFRVLIVANNNHGTLEEIENEIKSVKTNLEPINAQITVFEDNEPFEEIEAVLSEEKFHLLHFCGHAEYFSDENKRGLSIPSLKDGTNIISYGRFAQAVKNTGLWLVYLSCCYGAPTDIPEIGQTYLNCMEALIEEGIPNVVGFRWAIEDKSARRFAEEFYKELFGRNQVKELNLAMFETRKKLWNQPQYPDVAASVLLITQTN